MQNNDMQEQSMEIGTDPQVLTPEDEKKNESTVTNKFELEARQAREATKKLKRNILIVAAIMVVFVIVATLLIPVLDNAINGTEEVVTNAKPNTIIFYEPDYDYNIMQDAEYLELWSDSVYYTDIRSNETILISGDEIANYGPAVVTLKTMIDAIIAGDHETYNSLFSTNYFESDENRKPEPPFTMQQVYDVELTLVKTEDQVENNRRYTVYVFDVEYKIHKNNGTFRTDLGHDDTRPQRFILSNSTGTDVLIDQINNFVYVN